MGTLTTAGVATLEGHNRFALRRRERRRRRLRRPVHPVQAEQQPSAAASTPVVRTQCAREPHDRPHVQDAVDDEDAQALRAEGYDPDDPAVAAAIDIVRWELSLLLGFQR